MNGRRRSGAALVAALLALGSLGAACDGTQRPDRSAVSIGPAGDVSPGPRLVALRDSLARRVEGDSLLARLASDSGDVLIGIRTDLVREIAAWMAGSYLDRVELHLSPDVVVEHGEDVKVRVGPLRVHAGDWRVFVTIRSIRSTLRVGAVRIGVGDPGRLDATVAVASDGGAGDVTVDFRWDPAAVPSLVCDGFEVHEDFSGTLPPESYRVSGVLRLEGSPEGVLAVPDFSESPIRVRPRPTEESWARVRGILEQAEEGCGPLDPADVIEKLREVFERGFEFELPESLFRTVRLPTRIRESASVAGREVQVRARPVDLRVSEATIWYGSKLEATLSDAGPAVR